MEEVKKLLEQAWRVAEEKGVVIDSVHFMHETDLTYERKCVVLLTDFNIECGTTMTHRVD